MQVLASLKPQDIHVDFIFKDRLFSSLSNHAYTMYQIESKWVWLEIEEKARINLQKVDLMVESGTTEAYELFEKDKMRQVCEKMSLVLNEL